MVANQSPPSKATIAMSTGAPTTYTNPARPSGTTKERGSSGLDRRSFQAESTVSTVVAERSQIYTEISCPRLFHDSSAYTTAEEMIASHGVPYRGCL